MAILSNINDLFRVDSAGAVYFATSAGANLQVLQSVGTSGSPIWVDVDDIIGGPYLPLTGGILTGNLALTDATNNPSLVISTGSLTVGGITTLNAALTGTTATFSGLASGITPTAAANFATKAYVDAHPGDNTTWPNVGAGIRTNYTLGFKPPTSDYAGFYFQTSAGAGAGYLLIRGESGSGAYASQGISLIADAGWLSLVSRTTTDKGVRIMAGATATTRLKIVSAGDITFNEAYTFPTSDGSANQVLKTDGSGNLDWATDANDNTTWPNVGAGTRTNYTLGIKPPANGYAGFYFTTSTGTGEDAGYLLIRGTSDSGQVYKAEGITLVADAGWLSLVSRTTSTTGVRILSGSSSAERLVIKDDGESYFTGNLGIGTTSPDSLLVVQADAHNEAFAGKRSANDFLWFLRNENNSGRFQLFNSSSSQTIEMTGANGRINQAQMIAGTAFALTSNGYATFGSTSSSVPIAFAIDGDGSSPEMFIKTNGNVGIGTDAPSTKLEIVTVVGGDAIRLNFGQSADIFLGFNSANPRILLQDNSNIVTHNFQSNGDNYIVGSNIGIGTTSPDRLLEISHDAASHNPVLRLTGTSNLGYAAGIEWQSGFGPKTSAQIFSTASGGSGGELWINVRDQTTNTLERRMYFKNNGYIGIGTSAPEVKLDISGSIQTSGQGRFKGWYTGGSGLSVETGISAGDGYLLTYNRDTNAYGNTIIEATGIQFVTHSSGKFYFQGGSVGIGTTSPTTALSVSDGGAMYGNSNYLVQIKRNAANGDDNTSKASILLANNSNAMQIAYGGTTDRLRIIDGGGQERFTLLNGGNVGIGVTGPSEKLEISGKVKINSPNAPNSFAELNIGWTGGGETRAIDIDGNWGAGESKSISFTHGSAATNMVGQINCQHNGPGSRIRWGRLYHNNDSSTYTMELISSSSTTADLTVLGNITASADVVAYSDERLKSNIKTLDGLKVLKMRGVSFEKDGKKGSGVIAQELEKVAPELVHNKSEYKGVAYGNLTGYLIEAIKEQQKQIDRLEEQIKKMCS